MIEILKMNRLKLQGDHSETLAQFNVRVGPFTMRSGKIRRSYADGKRFATLPGKRDGNGIVLSDPAVREAVRDAALAHYSENFDG
ncbi:hypothetical protein T8J41_15980 [Nitratireductor rhodophyticola]|uniref:hypothetical protein n=1 Tax=Nitratireductor rhodophyticola TaxID=2854036 RepID=UPI002AC8D384|nr:hypothetical protein [Nitratireductor rhodophyticola]WPZ13632.1 hypothetical protein T8J41_15980 [Nitratireductor rhodophyticola]